MHCMSVVLLYANAARLREQARGRCASVLVLLQASAGASGFTSSSTQGWGRVGAGTPATRAFHRPNPHAFSVLYRICRLRPEGFSTKVSCASPRASSSSSSGEDAAGKVNRGACRDWTEDMWAEQLNIRDLESSSSSRQFFRTSCVFAPNKPADLLEMLVSERLVSVVLDLRSLDEMKTDVAASTFETVVFSRSAPPSMTAVREAAARGKLVRYVVPLLERDYILPSLRSRLPLGRRLAFIWFGLTNSRREQEMMVEEINKIGLGGLNELMLVGCGPEICWALQLMATLRQVPSAAMAVQCRLGKDRTGLIAALFKSTLGATDEDIIEDYKRSEGIDEIALGELQQRMEAAASPDKPVLDRRVFSGADPKNMLTTLAFIRSNHGTVDRYLDSIGFDDAWRKKLRGG